MNVNQSTDFSKVRTLIQQTNKHMLSEHERTNRGKRKMPSATAIATYWAPIIQETYGKSIDRDTCFKCGHVENEFNNDRAHIIARCDGGSDEVGNLWMLCKLCHKESELMHPWIKHYWVNTPRIDARSSYRAASIFLWSAQTKSLEPEALLNVVSYVASGIRKDAELCNDQWLYDFVDEYAKFIDDTEMMQAWQAEDSR